LFHKEKGVRNEVFYYRQRELYAVRVGSFKAHFITQEGYGNEKTYHNPPLLYNVDEDPSERFDIAENNPDILLTIQAVVEVHQSKMLMDPDLLLERDKKYLSSSTLHLGGV